MALIRVAFLGVSHWHAPLYYRPAARLPRVRIVAVSDKLVARRRNLFAVLEKGRMIPW